MAEARFDTLIPKLCALVSASHYKELGDGNLLQLFVANRDELAFKTLVRRHGPLILGVCRRVLGAGPDVDDVFQATFLVLARKAGSIRRQASISGWLYGVAFRLARKQKKRLDRQRGHEHSTEKMEAITETGPMGIDPAQQASLHELGAILDEEVQGLPTKNRETFVLCHVDGLSAVEAAKRLGCPLPTLKSRLARARELMRQRLVRRGITLSTSGLAVLSAAQAARAAVPYTAVLAALQGALAFAAKPAAGGAVSAQAASLAIGFLKTMTITKLSLAFVAVLTVTLLGFGAARGLDPAAGEAALPDVHALPNLIYQQTKPEKGPGDAKALQGDWQVVDGEADGKVPAQDPSTMVISFKGDEMTLGDGEGNGVKYKFKLDPGKSPRELYLTLLEEPYKNVTVRCIYSLEKGELKFCMPLGPKSSPAKEFKTTAGDGLLLLVLRRPSPSVKIQREWQRHDAPPDGNYKVSTVFRGYEETWFIIKLETKDGKQSGSLVDTASDFAGLKILQIVVSPTPRPSPPDAAGKTPAESIHIRISFKEPTLGEGSFEGDFPYGSVEARGFLEANQRVTPATLSATDAAKLKFTDRDIRPPLMQKAEGLAAKGLVLRRRAQQMKDTAEKARLLKEAALADADKEALAEVPKLYAEFFEKHADHPAVFDAALNMLKAATKCAMAVEQVRGMVARADKTAASYGRVWRLEFNTQIADALVSQNAYTALALETATRLEKLLLPSDTAERQARVLKAVAVAQGNARKVAEMEHILDREYRARLPLFKVDSFTGRKTNSDRAVVLELFTGAQCPPCVAADIAFDLLQQTYKPAELVLIQYHLHIPGPDPLTNADGEARWDYYTKSFPDKVRGVPTAIFNGKPEASGGGSMEKAEEKYKEYRQVIEPLLESDTGAKLAASAVKQGNQIDITASVTDLAKPGADIRLRLLLVEESIRYVGGNKVRFHHQVVRKLVGGPDGFALKDKDNRHTASVDLDELRKALSGYLEDYNSKNRQFPNSDRPLDFANLRVIALVQDDATHEILQALQVDVTEAKNAKK